MKSDGVNAAFEMIVEEILSVASELKSEAKNLIDEGNFDAVSSLMNTGRKLDGFRMKVYDLQSEWLENFDSDTRSRTRLVSENKERNGETVILVMKHGVARAKAELFGRTVRLLAGSTIKRVSNESLRDSLRLKKEEELKKGCIFPSRNPDLYEVKKPILFNSSSEAACFVAGCSMSGPREWMIENMGMSLKEYLIKQDG
jgi:hypothetical protein